ncbi:MAG: dual specificity protein phosphatase family protein [Planctomycetes bacterium]|nr:dual specificity protein phosphatase family protein [Planctomycetota bacterium]
MSVPYGFVFTVLAAVAAFAAVLASGPLWPLRIAGAVAALSFVLVAVAYFGAGPRLLFKRASGRRHPAAWLVHGAYFALTALSYRLTVLYFREAAFVEVAPNVFLGRRLTPREARRADAPAWVAVLDLAAELPEPLALCERENYRSLPVLDATAMSLAQLRDAVEWVKRHAASGPVYVHCALGHGRSATVAAAYLLAVGLAADAKGAAKRLRELRSGVRLHRAQRGLLARFAEERG